MSTPPIFDADNADTHLVAEWLETALDGYIKDDMGRWAFRPLEQYIGTRDDLAGDLCAIYDSLAATAQARWRSAIRDLLTIHGRDISKRETIRVLISFAVLIRSAEVLEVMPGIVSTPEDSELLDLAVGAATALASQTKASRRCLEQIRTLPSFTADYAGLVLVALCHADPDNWLRHVKNLSLPMRRLARLLPPESTAMRFYASNILDAISLSRLTGSSLNRLFAGATDGPRWLLHEWFLSDNSLLRCDRLTATSTRLALRVDDTVSTELEGSLDTTVLEAEEARSRQKTAIAWARGSGKIWAALYMHGTLSELTPIELSQEAIVSFVRRYISNFGEQNTSHWQSAKFGGLLFSLPMDGTPYTALNDDLLALWDDGSVPNELTKRLRYLHPYRSDIPPRLQRVAINDHHAFSATASAIALTHGVS